MHRLGQSTKWVIGALLCAGIILSCVAVVRLGVQPGLPDPSTADREGLLRWLVESDLSTESPQVCERLISRLAVELDHGVDWTTVNSHLDEDQRRRLAANCDVLLKQWFHQQAERYHTRSDTDKAGFLDAMIDRVGSWNISALFASSATSDEASDATGWQSMVQLARRVQTWITSAPVEERDKLEDFATAIQWRVASRRLNQPMPN